MHLRCALGATILAALAFEAALGQSPLGTGFTYQGQLKQNGQPYSGSANLVFKLFDAATGGNLLGTQTLSSVNVTGGLFTVTLNSADEFGSGAFNGEQRWLDISVNGTPLAPRQELTAGPYALFSTDSAQLAGQPASFYLNAGNLNAGTLAPARGGTGIDTSAAASGSLLYTSGVGAWSLLAPGADSQVLTLAGGVPTWGNPSGFTLPYSGSADVPSPNAVFTIANTDASDGTTLWCQNGATSGIALEGDATATTGYAYGGRFTSASPDGRAVFGQNTATTGWALGGRFGSAGTEGRAVYATASAALGTTYGVYGESLSTTAGTGVYGAATAASGYSEGVHGQSDSTSGYGVFGWATAATGYTEGVHGQSGSTSGVGVLGFASASSGLTYGGWFQSASTSGTAVYGNADAGTGATYGVYGQAASGAGWGIWANGRLGASGTKSFRIDHPDDPENKYLLHYSAESPEVINFYSGKVTLDAAGEAVVELPHYFAKINKDPRYTLTAVGAPMPMLHVAEEIDDDALSAGEMAGPGEAAPVCSFRIAGGAPGAKASWRVEAVRNDRWIQRRGAPVEVEKQDLEKGTYQHPELYGQPAEMGMNYRAEHERPSPAAPLERTPR